MATLRYISHPQVVVDPTVPVSRWGLSEEGKQRVQQLCQQPWMSDVRRVVSSAETKALEVAAAVAQTLGLTVEVRPKTGETDRSSTGYVPHDRHEQLADEFFALPHVSVQGWERAVDVQARMINALADLLTSTHGVVVVGHGAAGTLWYCAVAGLDIDRSHDQRSTGNYFAIDLATGKPMHPWQPIDQRA